MKRFALIASITFVIAIGFFVVFFSLLADPPFGGSKNAVFRVKTDPASCWSGFFVDASIDGCGSADYPVNSSIGIFSGSVQKKTDDGITLTLQLIIDDKIVDETLTNAAYGIAMASGSG